MTAYLMLASKQEGKAPVFKPLLFYYSVFPFYLFLHMPQ